MTEIGEALQQARAAYQQSVLALAAAEAAARAAGVDVTPTVVDRLSVHEIRVVEPDGTLRLLIGNSGTLNSVSVRGKEFAHPGRAGAGLLFVNDEGTECGGLVWGVDDAAQGVHLSMDSYEQNDALILGHYDEHGVRQSVLEFIERPRWSLADYITEVEAATEEQAEQVTRRYFRDGAGASRMRLGTDPDGSVTLTLRDAQARDRIRLVVPADGRPSIDLLDETGEPLGDRADLES